MTNISLSLFPKLAWYPWLTVNFSWLGTAIPIELFHSHPEALMRIVLLIPHVLVIDDFFVGLLTFQSEAHQAVDGFGDADSGKRVPLAEFPYKLVLLGGHDLGRESFGLGE